MKTENKGLCQREMSTKAVEEEPNRKPGKGNRCCSTPAVCLISDPFLDTEEEMVVLS